MRYKITFEVELEEDDPGVVLDHFQLAAQRRGWVEDSVTVEEAE